MAKARELDPLSASIARHLALPYFLKRDHDRAFELLQQANELGPALGATWEVEVYIQKGRLDQTLAELERLKRDRKDDPNLIFGTGMIYAAQGKKSEAVQVIKELEQMSGENLSHAQYIAKIYSTLNDKEMSLSWLERGVAAGAITAFYKDELVWDPIRDDSRFREILRRIGVT
jgi:tetratricopeptide (TPR) repeat protein